MSGKELRLAENPDQLANLWCSCFPEDADGYCSFFLNRWFRPDRCLVLREGTTVQSMVHLFTAELWNHGRSRGQFLYLYAIGTAPAFRGQGNLGRLLEGCLALAESKGLDGILLTSAEGLESLYEHYGMEPCAVRYETQPMLHAAEPLAWEPCGYADYAVLRRGYLASLPAAFAWQADSDRFIYEVQSDSGAVTQWREDGSVYYAVTGCEDGVPVLLETNHNLDSPFLSRVAATLGSASLKVCSPCPIDETSIPICFGHWRLIHPEATPQPDAYLNLIAD